MKKHQQLGMNAGTASHRLIKDLLFKFVTESGHSCFRCGLPLVRSDFSVEHKTAWLDSDDPVGLFFDLGNIAFSHLSCNSGAAKHGVPPNKKYRSVEERNKASWARQKLVRVYDSSRRRAQYERTGT